MILMCYNVFLIFNFSSIPNEQLLDPSLINDILRVMDDTNILVKCFRMVRDFREVYQNVPVQLRLFRNRSYDPRTYNVPEVGEVAALIVGDFDSSEDGRDIVVRERDGNLQRIHETHAKCIPLQYPLLFPFGEDQYQENIELNSLTTSNLVNKCRRVSLREFIAFRLHQRAVENYLVGVFSSSLLLMRIPCSRVRGCLGFGVIRVAFDLGF